VINVPMARRQPPRVSAQFTFQLIQERLDRSCALSAAATNIPGIHSELWRSPAVSPQPDLLITAILPRMERNHDATAVFDVGFHWLVTIANHLNRGSISAESDGSADRAADRCGRESPSRKAQIWT